MVMAAAVSMSHPLKGFNTKKQITVKPFSISTKSGMTLSSKISTTESTERKIDYALPTLGNVKPFPPFI
jgi:hypothetical protein